MRLGTHLEIFDFLLFQKCRIVHDSRYAIMMFIKKFVSNKKLIAVTGGNRPIVKRTGKLIANPGAQEHVGDEGG